MSAPLSLDAARALVHSRNVGAWPSNRGGVSDVLQVPQRQIVTARPALPAPMQAPAMQQQARRTGQMLDTPPPMPPGCCVFPGTMKYIAASVTLAAALGSTGTVTLDSPGMFCPQKMLIFTEGLASVTSIKAGTRNQILAGTLPAAAFSINNTCCPMSCLDCLCMPGVPLEISFSNDVATENDITVVLIGCYVEACPPGGMAVTAPMAPAVPGCPTPGVDKFVGFDSVADVGAAGSFTFEVETPGRFCPRQMLLFVETTFAGVTVTGIRSGTDDQILEGALPAELWSIDNDCCVLACFKCLCAPGVPLTITVANAGAAQRIRGMLVGTYAEAC